MQRISWPEEPKREAAVRNLRRVIELAADLDVPMINAEFSGRPERSEDSEAAFYRTKQELLPVLQHTGMTLNFEPHPDDFVEDGHEAWRIIRGLNCDRVGFVYVASHTFHDGDQAASLIPELDGRLGAVYLADTFDHRRSHGLRYITDPPGSTTRVHQHLAIGHGDVDFPALFATLRASGFLDQDDALLVSNVFAEDESTSDVSARQLTAISELLSAAAAQPVAEGPRSRPRVSTRSWLLLVPGGLPRALERKRHAMPVNAQGLAGLGGDRLGGSLCRTRRRRHSGGAVHS